MMYNNNHNYHLLLISDRSGLFSDNTELNLKILTICAIILSINVIGEIIMTYNEAVERIDSLLVFGSQPGLERVGELVKRLGSPDKSLRFVHAAGTNGKGSTCALIAAALREQGYRTGLFISPYVLEFRERFMINGEMIPPQTLADIVEEIFPLVETMKAEGKIITEFEFVFAVALTWYAREKCDIVVLETGLGGRFDATNIIDCPLVSVITSISLDHTRILGDTYAKIAFEKCGIIKQGGITAAYADQKPEALAVIKNIAAERENELITADCSGARILSEGLDGLRYTIPFDGEEIDISLRLTGTHQVKNSVTALCALSALRKRGVAVSNEAIKRGFASVSFPARMELLSEDPTVLLDGAHNPGGAQALADALEKYIPHRRKVGIVGMLADKDIDTALGMLLPLFDEVITVAPDNPRKMPAAELAAKVSAYCGKVSSFESHEKAYAYALSRTGKDDALIIFGSLYLASSMRAIIKRSGK